MNTPEVALVLDMLATNYQKPIPPELIEIWEGQLGGVDVEVAVDAADNMIAVEVFFPTLAVFNKYVADEIRARARMRDSLPVGAGGPNPDCGFCSGTGWYGVDPVQLPNSATGEVTHYRQEKPCERCNPRGFEAWGRYCEERKNRRQRKVRPDETFDYNPKEALETARRELAQADERAKARAAAEANERASVARRSA